MTVLTLTGSLLLMLISAETFVDALEGVTDSIFVAVAQGSLFPAPGITLTPWEARPEVVAVFV